MATYNARTIVYTCTLLLYLSVYRRLAFLTFYALPSIFLTVSLSLHAACIFHILCTVFCISNNISVYTRPVFLTVSPSLHTACISHIIWTASCISNSNSQSTHGLYSSHSTHCLLYFSNNISVYTRPVFIGIYALHPILVTVDLYLSVYTPTACISHILRTASCISNSKFQSTHGLYFSQSMHCLCISTVMRLALPKGFVVLFSLSTQRRPFSSTSISNRHNDLPIRWHITHTVKKTPSNSVSGHDLEPGSSNSHTYDHFLLKVS
jgi:hypothetical protein